MRAFHHAAIVLSLNVLFGAGCAAGKKEDPVAGAQCQAVLYSACTRAIDDCSLSGYPSTADDCVTEYLPSCCGDSCDKKALSPESDIARCQRAIAAAACNVFDGGGLPPECLHVVRY